MILKISGAGMSRSSSEWVGRVMNFKRLLPTGFAVAAGLMMTVSGAKAQTEITYTSIGVTPELKLVIDDFGYEDDSMNIVEGYTITLSSMGGEIDVLALAFDSTEDWEFGGGSANDPTAGMDGQIFLTEAWTAPGSEGGPAGEDTSLDTAILNKNLCTSTTGITTCPIGVTGASVNFNGTLVNDADGRPPGGSSNPPEDSVYENIAVVGTQGEDGTEEISDFGTKGLDEVELFFRFANADLDAVDGNPFSNFALRGQTFAIGTGPGEILTDPDDPDSPVIAQNSITINFNTGVPTTCTPPDPACTPQNPPDNRVPEIDGPVLIQVGFALGGLYLLLLGRRRQEDELAHAA